MTFFQIFFDISFHIALESMYINFGDPKSIIADFQFSRPKKCQKALKSPKMTFLKMTFFGIFFNISFPIVLEAMYIKFGDPKSIIADFQFSGQKKG